MTVSNPFRYNGEYYDEETEMIYLRNRYYDPSIGRFITEDPAKDGLNWYVYCANNPVNCIDPTGLDFIVITDEDAVPLPGATYGEDSDWLGYGGHTSAMVQDEYGSWWYFYWGDKNVDMILSPDWAMDSLDALNNWLGSYGGTYDRSTYIKGDFTESFQYFSDLWNEYNQNGGGKNEKYNAATSNCLDMTVRGMNMGNLQDGTPINDFGRGNYGMRPNFADDRFREDFYNDAFTYTEYHKQINDQLWEARYRRDTEWLGKYRFGNLVEKLEKLY